MDGPTSERRLAFVAPERRALVEARIAVLENHLAITKPTVADADRAAEALGMTRNSFYRLLGAWVANRDPTRVGPVSGPREPYGRRPHPGDDFVRDSLSRLPMGRPLNRDVAAIEAAATRAGVGIRSRTSLRLMVRDLRGGGAEPADGHDAFVDHAVVQIAVEGPDGPTMPLAAVLGSRAASGIVAVSLSLGRPGPETASAVIVHAIEHGTGVVNPAGARIAMAIDTDFDPAWETFFHVLDGHGIERTGEERRVLRSGRTGGPLLYPKLLDLPAHTLLTTRDPTSRRPPVRARADRTLTLEQAQRAMDERVAAAKVDSTLVLPEDARGLAAALRPFLAG